MSEITKEDVEQLRTAARILSRPGEVEIARETAANIEKILQRIAEEEQKNIEIAKLQRKEEIKRRFRDAFRQAVAYPNFERHLMHLVDALEEWINDSK
jgi:Asp-tRNA(Asn)/Glu-tRNA(Gln) amidotransferase C subunit